MKLPLSILDLVPISAGSTVAEALRNTVDAHITGRFLGIFGEPRINVLELNLALDGVQPSK